jgi:hypothetical protein
MLSVLKDEARRLLTYFRRERTRGHHIATTLFFLLPGAVVRQLYGKAAHAVNGRVLRALNVPRFRAFQRQHGDRRRPCFYIVVMPDVLHFLVPCLRLVPPHVEMVLLYNGAHSWERAYLQARFPHLPAFTIRTLPWSSLVHGDLLTMLLEHHEDSFGLLDHDMYIFDRSIFDRLDLQKQDYALGIFPARSERTGIHYPRTHFLVLNAARFREIMRKYRVDARRYRRVPRRVQPVLDRIGFESGVYLNDYNVFDTLHLLYALAHAEGLRPRFLRVADLESVAHVGGTSIGNHRTRDLTEEYIQYRFLESVADEELRRRYLDRREFASSAEILSRLQPSSKECLEPLDELLGRLRGSLRTPAGGGH